MKCKHKNTEDRKTEIFDNGGIFLEQVVDYERLKELIGGDE